MILRRALALSAAAHLLLGLTALAGFYVRRPLVPPPPPAEATAEMIFVDPGGGKPGARPAPPAAAPTPAAVQPEPVRAEPPQAVSEPQSEPQSEPEPQPPATPAPKTMVQEPSPSRQSDQQGEQPEIRIGENDAGGITSNAHSDDIPAGPDPTAPNIPPRYPADAVRHGQEGVVILQVAVAPDGGATGVDVYVSSGTPSLDRAARDAVARWRFRPKMDAGRPAAAHALIGVRFKLY